LRRAAAGEIGINFVTLQVWTFNEDAQAFFRPQGTPVWRDFGIDKVRELRPACQAVLHRVRTLSLAPESGGAVAYRGAAGGTG
jgi:hypothetical protein